MPGNAPVKSTSPFQSAVEREKTPTYLREYIRTIHDTVKDNTGKVARVNTKLDYVKEQIAEVHSCVKVLDERLQNYPEMEKTVNQHSVYVKAIGFIVTIIGGLLGYIATQFKYIMSVFHG